MAFIPPEVYDVFLFHLSGVAHLYYLHYLQDGHRFSQNAMTNGTVYLFLQIGELSHSLALFLTRTQYIL